MAKPLFWFRIELNAAGKVVSCRRVDACGDAEAGAVYFLRALSDKDASKKAFNEYHRLRLAARRARYAAEGKCKCGRERDGETEDQRALAQCQRCLKLEREQKKRRANELRGIPVEPIDKSARFHERRADEKLDLLKAVRLQFQRLTMREFGVWLNGEIAKHEEPAPKLRAV